VPLGKVVVDICYQCALTLVAATAPHRARPEADRDLADGIAAAAVQTLHRHNHSGKAAVSVDRRSSAPMSPSALHSPQVAALRHRGQGERVIIACVAGRGQAPNTRSGLSAWVRDVTVLTNPGRRGVVRRISRRTTTFDPQAQPRPPMYRLRPDLWVSPAALSHAKYYSGWWPSPTQITRRFGGGGRAAAVRSPRAQRPAASFDVKRLVLATVDDEFALGPHGRESGRVDHPEVPELSRYVGVLLERPTPVVDASVSWAGVPFCRVGGPAGAERERVSARRPRRCAGWGGGR